jgi:hypothetical protein
VLTFIYPYLLNNKLFSGRNPSRHNTTEGVLIEFSKYYTVALAFQEVRDDRGCLTDYRFPVGLAIG